MLPICSPRALAALILATLASQSCLGGSHVESCPAYACGSSASLLVHAPADFGGLNGGRVTACRNGLCIGVPLTTKTVGDAGAAVIEEKSTTKLDPQVAVSVSENGTARPKLRVTWTSDQDAKDGDRYRVTVTNAAGVETVLFDEAVTYPPSTRTDSCHAGCRSVEIDRYSGNGGS